MLEIGQLAGALLPPFTGFGLFKTWVSYDEGAAAVLFTYSDIGNYLEPVVFGIQRNGSTKINRTKRLLKTYIEF